ncbi:hypothetical protein cypCar_00039826 [Cyprinus carpio]|nr:hypothetical protein cypCar_00039826 [Cyprinus carpio]
MGVGSASSIEPPVAWRAREERVRYKRDFEESKGRGFSIVTDTPELQRLRRTQEHISNLFYTWDSWLMKGLMSSAADTPEIRLARENTKNISDAKYKKAVDPVSVGVTPELERVRQNQQNISMHHSHHAPQHQQGYAHMQAARSVRSPPHTQRVYRALYDYAAHDHDEVSFRDGDVIVNAQPIDEGWMFGTVQRTGKSGMLPANYVECLH